MLRYFHTRGQLTKGASPAAALSKVLTTPHHYNLNVLRIPHRGLGTGLILQYNIITYRVLVGKLEGRRPRGRPRRRWEGNIKMDLREVAWGTRTGSIWLKIRTGGGFL
jgi:hypothetical protein